MCCVGSGVAREWGRLCAGGWGRLSEAGLFLFSPLLLLAFYSLSMLLLPLKGYFFVDEKDTSAGFILFLSVLAHKFIITEVYWRSHAGAQASS